MDNTKWRTRGSAIISALFIVALVAIAATAMSMRLQLDIYRTQLLFTSDKLYLSSQAVVFWAMNKLSDKKTILLSQDDQGAVLVYPKSLQSIYPEIRLKARIYDLQARLNLNNLQDKKQQSLRLLLKNQLNMKDNQQIEQIIQSVSYWISPYQPDRGHDTLLQFYLSQTPPYLPGYQPMQSISELRLVKGLSNPQFLTLKNEITTLPESTPVNLNTASKTLLMSLGLRGLTEKQAQTIINARGDTGMTDLKEIALLLDKTGINRDQITLSSQYYLCVATAQTHTLNLTRFVLLKKSINKQGHIQVSLINESLNTE